MSIKIEGVEVGPGQPPYIVAELSANHNGSLEQALRTITAAKQSGANAIKLQTYTADTMTIDSARPEFRISGGPWDGYKLYDLYRWAETPYEWHPALFAHARKLGITVFSTPFDETAVDLLESLDAPAYKIASFELTDLPLIEYVARTGKPMIMSTGMASEAEIEDAVTTARKAGCRDLILLHCVSSYPAPMEQANLAQIPTLANRFGVVAGLSDHTLGTTAAIAAVALGASFIEKHMTLDRNDEGPDAGFSIEPDELARLCNEARNAWLATGKAGFSRQPSEESNRAFRRSVYFVKSKKAGETVEAADLRRIRPGLGLPPKHFSQLIGRTLRVDVEAGTPTSWEQFHG